MNRARMTLCETCGEYEADLTMSAEAGGPGVHVCAVDAGIALTRLLESSERVTVSRAKSNA